MRTGTKIPRPFSNVCDGWSLENEIHRRSAGPRPCEFVFLVVPTRQSDAVRRGVRGLSQSSAPVPCEDVDPKANFLGGIAPSELIWPPDSATFTVTLSQ